jgi:lipoprotein-anchoring transpeptidase ErfK/SrfK
VVGFVKGKGIALPVAVVIAGTAAGTGHAAVPRTETLALLLRPAKVYYRPDVDAARPHQLVSPTRPYTHTRTLLPVLAQKRSSDGRRWLFVLLPGRPNGHAGWIAVRGTRLTWTRWHLVIDTRARKVLVYRFGKRVAAFNAVVGNAGTPTPRGRFFIEETLALRPDVPGAPYALALSAHSTVYQEFAGGPGQVAIHSTFRIGGELGTAVSHGCIRLSAQALRWIASRIGTGVPVTIT